MPSPEADEKLHVSQACLAPGAAKNARATLLLRVGESEEALAVAALREGGTECVSLDLVLDQYTEFSVQGNAQIHLTGYYMPEYAIDGEGDEDDDDEDGANQIIGFDEYGVPVMANEYDSEDDSDYKSEDGEEDSEDEFDSDDEDELGGRNVTIEDITESEQPTTGKKKALAVSAPASANGKKAAAKAEQFSDSDVEGSDEEESGSEEESESEEEKPVVKAAKGKQAAPAPAAKGQKRKAEEPAPAPAAKSAQKAKKEDKKEDKKTPKKEVKKDEDKVAAGQVASGNKRVRRFANGFEIEDLKMGAADGKLAKPGKKVIVKYVGKLKNGKVFDQTAGNKTFAFRLGVGEVIKGWDRGVEGMRVGDKRRLIVPPLMGYGATRTGPIPPNSELHFDVELVDVK